MPDFFGKHTRFFCLCFYILSDCYATAADQAIMFGKWLFFNIRFVSTSCSLESYRH